MKSAPVDRIAPLDKLFISLGVFEFPEDKPARVTRSNAEANGHVIADAIQFLPFH